MTRAMNIAHALFALFRIISPARRWLRLRVPGRHRHKIKSWHACR